MDPDRKSPEVLIGIGAGGGGLLGGGWGALIGGGIGGLIYLLVK
jgi:hypothetical protein